MNTHDQADAALPGSRRLAQTWPFPRYYAYERKMRETAKQWFDGNFFIFPLSLAR